MTHQFRALQDYGRVLLLVDGKLAADVEWKVALEIAEGIRKVAKRAEEWAKAEQIAADHALALRSGFPVGLTAQPKIVDEANKLATYDRTLRRAISSSVRTRDWIGVPGLIDHKGPAPHRRIKT